MAGYDGRRQRDDRRAVDVVVHDRLGKGFDKARLYLEALEEVFSTVESKVIVDADLQGKMLPLLPLEKGATR